VKFVAFSDLHLDAPFAWLGEADIARRRRDALRIVLERITGLAQAEHADALLCAGDLYEHDRVTPDTAAFLVRTFAALHPMPVYLAPGNHDWYGPSSIYARADWSPNVHVFTTPRFEPVKLAAGVTLWGAGHDRPAGTKNLLRDFHVEGAGTHLALFHGSEIGWLRAQGNDKVAHAPFEATDLEAAGFEHAFVGHYHCPRQAPRYTYPGNPDPLAFGETGDRGAIVATLHGQGNLLVERRAVAATRVHDINVDVSGCRDRAEIQARVTAATDSLEGLLRVTLWGELAPQVDVRFGDFKVPAPGVEAVCWRLANLRTGYDLDAIAHEQTVRGQFVRDVRAADLEEDERQGVLLTGLRALDGRDDLEVF
jgi:DNA repair exonuclease SbcCD nuclease subunit